MATQATYCTERDLKDIFPEVDSYDTKTPVYGWVVHSGSLYRADNCGLITLLFANGQDLGAAEANSGVVNVEGEWYYDSALDAVYYYSASNPNDKLMESGEDFATLKTRYMKNASEFLDSRLDGTLPRERFKDQDGNYDYIIVRTSALISAVFLIRSHDPTSEVASALWDEATDNIDKINNGETKLSWQVTQSDSQGTVREVSVSGALRIVDTRGHYVGVYDRIKVKVIAGGAIGTSTYSVWTSGSDKLGIHEGSQVVTAKTINGDYQSLAGGLQIRFAGDKTDTATADDEWEIEVTGKYEAVDNARPKTIKMTRRGTPQAFRWQ